MVLARKESIYINEEINERQQLPNNRKKPVKKNKFLEKLIITATIISIFVFSIFVLTRFTVITKSKHVVDGLHRQIQELELEKEKLRVEVEKVSKSGWIEKEAMERLNMQYPTPEQIAYININPDQVLLFKNEINKTNENIGKITKSNEEQKPYTLLEKLVGYIGI